MDETPEQEAETIFGFFHFKKSELPSSIRLWERQITAMRVKMGNKPTKETERYCAVKQACIDLARERLKKAK